MTDVENWPALADAVKRRRAELGWGGGGFTLVSTGTAVYAIEWARRGVPGPHLLAPIEHALGWPEGLAFEVLAGTAAGGEILP